MMTGSRSCAQLPAQWQSPVSIRPPVGPFRMPARRAQVLGQTKHLPRTDHIRVLHHVLIGLVDLLPVFRLTVLTLRDGLERLTAENRVDPYRGHYRRLRDA